MRSMCLIYFLIIFVKIVTSAPTVLEEKTPDTVVLNRLPQDEFYRDKRSKFGVYVSPCAASGSMPAYGPANYQYNAPYHGGGYSMPPNNAYPAPHPHYRSEDSMENEREMLNFPNMEAIIAENLPFARYVAYSPPPSASHVDMPVGPGPMIAPAAPPPVFSVFPNANVAGCNTPLMFTCTPSIVTGHLMKPQPHYGYTNPDADSYRGVDEPHPDSHEEHQEVPVSNEPASKGHGSHIPSHQ